MMQRRHFHVRLAIGCSLLVYASVAMADEIAVIVARAAAPLQLDEGLLRDIYLKKIVLDATGRKFVPVNLPAANPVREVFSRALFHQDSGSQQDYWNQRYFHGVTPPYVLASQDAVVRFVAQTPGAIGYVLSCHMGAGVTRILSLPVPDGTAAEGGCTE